MVVESLTKSGECVLAVLTGIHLMTLRVVACSRRPANSLRHRHLEMVKRPTARVTTETNARKCDVDRVGRSQRCLNGRKSVVGRNVVVKLP